MLKRMINKIMKIKYVDAEGVERCETHRQWQDRITKEVEEIGKDVDRFIEESRKERQALTNKTDGLMRNYLKNAKDYIDMMKKVEQKNDEVTENVQELINELEGGN